MEKLEISHLGEDYVTISSVSWVEHTISIWLAVDLYTSWQLNISVKEINKKEWEEFVKNYNNF